jgi:hypothetical protein
MLITKVTFATSALTAVGTYVGAATNTFLGIPHFPSVLAGIAAVATSLLAVQALVVRPLMSWGHRQDDAIAVLQAGQQRTEVTMARILGHLDMPPDNSPPGPPSGRADP